MGVIVLSTVSVVAETVPELESYWWAFQIVEKVVTVFFSSEILVRIWVADYCCDYLVSWGNTVDMMSTLPWYLEQAIRLMDDRDASELEHEMMDPFAMARRGIEDSFWTLRMIRLLQMIRLLRILRLAKAARHSETMTTVIESIRASINGLTVLVGFVCMGTLVSATVVFFLESQEDHTLFVSIPAALWWALATITAVGYGDMVPETVIGKVAGCFTMLAGVLIISLSAAIITSSFVDQYQRNMQRRRIQKAQVQLRASNLELPLDNPVDQALAARSSGLPSFSGLLLAEEDGVGEVLQELEEGVKKTLLCLHSVAYRVHDDAKLDALSVLEKQRQPAGPGLDLVYATTSVDLLREQSKTWFKLARQFSEEVLMREAACADTSYRRSPIA